MNKIERYFRKRNAAAAIASGYLAVSASGCAIGNHEPSHTSAQNTERPTTVAPSTSSAPKQRLSPLQESMAKVRQDFARHQGRVLLDLCVGWPNQSGGITVTIDPILASLKKPNRHKEEYYVFSAVDKNSDPDKIIPMDGPSLNSSLIATAIYHFHRHQGEVRKISSLLHKDTNGQRYYTDTETHLPVMDTVVTGGPVRPQRFEDVCNALYYHHTIPPGSSNSGSTGSLS